MYAALQSIPEKYPFDLELQFLLFRPGWVWVCWICLGIFCVILKYQDNTLPSNEAAE